MWVLLVWRAALTPININIKSGIDDDDDNDTTSNPSTNG